MMIKNTEYNLILDPFPHTVVDDFFTEKFHSDLRQAFEEQKLKGLSEVFNTSVFSKFPGYDAHSWVIPPSIIYPLNFFYSLEWFDYIQRLFGISLSKEVCLQFHHHHGPTVSDHVHNDFNTCFFKDAPLPHGINPWYFQCNYMGGNSDDTLLQRVRGVTVIYYLNNPVWKLGDGGETGLYRTHERDSLFNAVAPISNRMLAFECGPGSFHGYMANQSIERNSIIQFFHTTVDVAQERHNCQPSPFSTGDIEGKPRT